MIDCLLDMKSAVALAKPHAERLPDEQLDHLLSRCQFVLDEGYALNPRPAPLPRARRGRPRNTKAGNLLDGWISIARKNALNAIEAITLAFDGHPFVPIIDTG